MSVLATRRGVLGAGSLVVAFALDPKAFGQGAKRLQSAEPRGDLARYPMLDAWIRIGADGRATVFTGKAELGQGIKTALLQVAADELDLTLDQVSLVTADTARTPNEGVTAGSHSMQDSGMAIRAAAADVRRILVEAAAARWSVEAASLAAREGVVLARDGRRIGYGDLAAGLDLHVPARPDAPLKAPADQTLIGAATPRVDIPGKLTGAPAYVQDLRLPGMLHARVVRGPSDGTRLNDPDVTAAAAVPGVVKIVRQGRFLAIVAETEWAAIQAQRIAQARGWTAAGPPIPADPQAALMAAEAQDVAIFRYPAPPAQPAVRALAARYSRPYLMHGAIGPSCAVALWNGEGLTVWTHSQGVAPLQGALADLLALPSEKIRCIHVEGAGCYGHNGADDVAADAALAARAVPGRPVRLQWMREQEHGFEPLGSAMVARLEAGLDASGRIASWRHAVWSNAHNGRPVSGGGLLAGLEVEPPFRKPPPRPIPMPEGGGDRNANPLYALPDAQGTYHFVADAPVRVSALRSLGAHLNVFAIESFMDELASAAGQDPVAFRLAHLKDARASDVIAHAADRFGWAARPRGAAGGEAGAGCGFAFARYKNLGAYCAVAMQVEVEPVSGRVTVRRALAAVDSGAAVNPDGIANQIEGAIVQSLSWTLLEETALARHHRASFDWSAYPIARFADVPDAIEVHIIDRPDQPFLGTGEAAQGPAAAALANAIADATGLRLRDLPLSPQRLGRGSGP
ncbi:MAG TPA: molybdopterin cofactor-binding domain-containing protein [Caulobacteraceae bacterium]|jgi:CO/xanthine dehydrogenase Mo-binding subunit|nr:molybdopterin cofactor-binding domain-containing protein [Caulobacteraceae bacterium]